jgi:hypothetical protein
VPLLTLMYQRIALNNFKLLSTMDQSQLPSKLTNQSSTNTREVSSPVLLVELASTTVFSLSDMDLKTENHTMLSRTPGVHHGEKKDLSDLLSRTVTVSVVSK